VTPAIEARALRRSFGRRDVLRGVDLAVGPGEVVALAGPNGAGKSTLIAALAGLLRPDSGDVRLLGEDPRLSAAARARLGLLLHEDGLYDDLTAVENVALFARLFGLDGPEAAARAALDEAGLADRAGDLVRTFSRGIRRRVALARATLHRPAVLLLDEPAAGLDEAAVRRLERTISDAAARGAAIVYATHGAPPAGTTLTARLAEGRLA
jgi:heme ABC exporter ATP-binding subunit CcmA